MEVCRFGASFTDATAKVKLDLVGVESAIWGALAQADERVRATAALRLTLNRSFDLGELAAIEAELRTLMTVLPPARPSLRCSRQLLYPQHLRLHKLQLKPTTNPSACARFQAPSAAQKADGRGRKRSFSSKVVSWAQEEDVRTLAQRRAAIEARAPSATCCPFQPLTLLF